jgi:formylglycine-generating enzyme required for sulfatase activity
MNGSQNLAPFLSHNGADAAAAETLRSMLAKAGVEVFHAETSIGSGDRWISRLESALAGCRAFILLVGREGVNFNYWNGAEVQVALGIHLNKKNKDREQLPIHLVLLPEADPELLPSLLKIFQSVRWSPGELLPPGLCDALRHGVQQQSARKEPAFIGCPFRGLGAFGRQHAELFFGRRFETLQALAGLGDQQQADPHLLEDEGSSGKFHRWLQVEGNSGSGKSSLVMAGLLPLIESGALWSRTGLVEWKVLDPMRPGRDPVGRLAEALEHGLKTEPAQRDSLAVSKRLAADDRALSFAIRDVKVPGRGHLLVIDQFEELFTMSGEESRRRFDGLLANALSDPDCPLFLISTVRADFLDRFDQLPRLEALYNDRCKRYFLPAITPAGLREAIELPAKLAGIDVSEVTTAMLAEARDEPGALPLVENALLQLWHAPRPQKLEGTEFHARGGLAGMLSSSADQLLSSIEREIPKGRLAALELLLRLTHISSDGRHTRQRVSRAEAVQAAGNGDDALGERVLNLLSGGRVGGRPDDEVRPIRLVTTGVEGEQPYVDLIHETLVRTRLRTAESGTPLTEPYWPTLHAYIRANRNRDIARQQLALQVDRWQTSRGFTRWSNLALWSQLSSYARLRPVRGSIEERFLKQSRRAAWAMGAVCALVALVFLESAWWTSVNRLPMEYVFIQPLWYLGWTPKPELVKIHAGHFTMGCKQGRDTAPDEPCKSPSTELDMTDEYSLGKYAVTFLQYDRYVWAHGGKGRSPELYPADAGFGRFDRPVINVNWHDATAYARWLGEITGETYRLPSDKEWEYASRGGKDTRFPWNESPEAAREANCRTCVGEFANQRTAPVGSFKENGFGLYDAIGNVWQWVADVPSADQTDVRFIRGGSWNSSVNDLVPSHKNSVIPKRRNMYIGFRVAMGRNPAAVGLKDIPVYTPTQWSSKALSPAQRVALESLRVSLSVCEDGVPACGSWTFVGLDGAGVWPTGEVAKLTIVEFDADTIVVRREDVQGPKSGKRVTYSAGRTGNQLTGQATEIVDAGDTSAVRNWHAVIGSTFAPLPPLVRACVTPDYKFCWTFSWTGRQYEMASDTDITATQKGIASAISFDPASVVFWAENNNGYWSLSSGRISNLGSRIMDAQFSDSNGTKGNQMFVWGDAIEEMPVSPRKPPLQTRSRATACYSWFTGVLCR